MKLVLQWVCLCASSLAPVFLAAPVLAQTAQTTPTPQGTSVADSAVPAVISPAAQGSGFFVLNQDLSLLTHSTVDSSLNGTCAAPPGFAATSATPRTFLNDNQNAYFTAASSADANAAVSGFSFINTGLCQAIQGPEVAGGTPTSTFTSNDTFHGKYFVLSAFNGQGTDTLTVESNLNYGGSGGRYVTRVSTVPLDTGAQYTSMVTDTSGGASGYSLTAITELKTATSPGNLWIYSQTRGTAYKILGPGGVPLPAIGSFLIPAQTNGGGALLVLINQDNLTATNLSNPPPDTTPFTIIDLGQLIQTFSVQTTGGTITLPFVTQIPATTPYFAMLGAAYNPVTRLVYAVVGGGSQSAVTANVISYDPFHPGSPSETVVGDVSNIPFSYGSYPQLALSAAAGTLQILTSNPAAVYSVGILGTGNTAVAVPGSTFPDSSFQPTAIAANPLLGETYIASASGQVDILKNTAATPQATMTLNGPDIATMTQSYALLATALYPTSDTALRAAPVTITATPPAPGTSFTVNAGNYGNFGLNPSNVAMTFPALGVYTLVASVPATVNYPAFTSNPVNVTVASNFIAGVYPTTLAITAPSNSPTTAVNVLVNLGGSTYAPTGHIDVKDGTGKVVGSTYFNGAALVQPTTVPVTLAQGPNTLTAFYNGDAQNAPATSPALQISVGTTVTPTLVLSNVGPTVRAATGNNTGRITFGSSTTTPATGDVTIYYVYPGGPPQTLLATVPAAAAFSSTGASFTYISPSTPGTYTVYASYLGDTNYAAATSPGISLTVTVPLATTMTVTAPATIAVNTTFSVNIKLASATSTLTPTGIINVTAKLAGSSTSTGIGQVDAAQAYTGTGTSFSADLLTPGVWTVTATYNGGADFNPSSGTATVTVSPATAVATTLKISTPPASVAVNTAYTAVVTLTAASPLTSGPSGLVTIVVTSPSGAVVSTISTTAASAFLGTGYTAAIPAAATPGIYTLTASYAGDTNYSSSTASSTVSVSGSSTTPTTLGISAPSSPLVGTTFIVTATLKATGSPTAAITGKVNLMATGYGGTPNVYMLGSVPASSALVSGGVQFTVSIPATGTYTLALQYPGDANYAPSGGSSLITVKSVPTSITISSNYSNVTAGTSFGTNIKLVPGTASTPAPTGNVTVTSTLAGTTISTTTLSAASVLAGAFTTFTPTQPGTYTITANYPGDADYLPSTSSVTVAVSALPTPTVSIGQTLGAVAVPVPLTVTLGDANGKPIVSTGSITITSSLDGVSGPSTTVAGTAATATLTFPTPGVYHLVASFAGDASYGPARSDAFGNVAFITIYTATTLPDFTLQTQDPSLTTTGTPVHIPSDSKGNFPLLTTSLNGFKGLLTLTVALSQSAGSTSAESIANINPNAPDTKIVDLAGNPITSIHAGDQFSVVVYGGSSEYNGKNRSPMARNGGIFACFLLGIFCLRLKLRRGTRGALKAFAGVLLIACLGTLTPGCGIISQQWTVNVTAVSPDVPGLTKTVSFSIVEDGQNPNSENNKP